MYQPATPLGELREKEVWAIVLAGASAQWVTYAVLPHVPV